jgi:CheY-like chemotaxis protein/anti-sigma regulatory factor (Ser/Thr protein kinase)
MAVTVLFVDDEEDIRFSFEAHFEGLLPLLLAADGTEALDVLNREPAIGVVVTDIRMPAMSGLELIRQGREVFPDLGFIVVSGHGEVADIIEALRLGARNYLAKPYQFEELGQAILQEIRRYEVLQAERERREREKYLDQFLTSVEGLTYRMPTRLDLVNPIAFRLTQTLETVGICDERDRGNVALALIEIITNAIEHGNLGLSGQEKIALKNNGDHHYWKELSRRQDCSPFMERMVHITAEVDMERAVFVIRDEGGGFDHERLPDPTHPANLFLPSGRGILLARTFLDEVTFLEQGNVVRLVKRKPRR